MGNKYVEIDREMSKAFREFESITILPILGQESANTLIMPLLNADVPAEYTLVPGMYSSFREEYLKEITIRLEAANRRRERKMGGRK